MLKFLKYVYIFGLIAIASLKVSFCYAFEKCFPANSCHAKGVKLYKQKNYIESLTYSKEAAKLRLADNDILLWKSYRNIAFAYQKMDLFREAKKYFLKAYETKGNQSKDDYSQILRNIGDCLSDLGEMEQALVYGRKAVLQNRYDPDARTVYAAILNSTNDSIKLLEAIQHSEAAILFCKNNEDDEYMLETLEYAFLEKGNSLNSLGRYEQAVKFYENALNLMSDTLDHATILNNIATIYYEQGKHKLAIQKLKESMNLLLENYKTDLNYDFAANFENLADNHTALQQFDTALSHYQKAIINLTNNFRTEDIFQNPNPKDSSLFIYSNPDMIRVLQLKATAAYKYYQKNKDTQYLNLANQTYQTTFNFHDQLQKELSTENSRLFQAKNIVPYIENALKVAYQQQENGIDISKTAFRFMEKNKATVLLQSMNEADALQFANLPDTLLEQEKDLKIAITFHNKQLNEAIEYEVTTEIKRLDKILFEEKQQYSRLINYLENNYPNYYRLKYQQNQTQLANVQNQLNDQTALLEYFVGDSSIYTLLILKDKSHLFKTQKPADWEVVINNFQETIALSNREDQFNKYNKKSFIKFINNGQVLYQYLLQEPLNELDQISNLKIIPDGALNYIPFDLLLTNSVDTSSVDYKNLPYLLKQKTISYAYSAALMLEQEQTDNNKKDFAYGGYAPKYDNSTDSDLPQARQLVNNMASFFKGKKHLNEAASKTSFLKDSLKYQVLHLAMHGKINDQYPLNSHLVFAKPTPTSAEEDYKLYAADLYLHEVNTDLAILNACETGTGELRKGEGVMSLSRAFTYAGCPSLLMSLWSIDEQSSVEILDSFLTNIKKDSRKDVLLRKAKLDYLNKATANFSHPYYWAGLVLSGNTETIEFKIDATNLPNEVCRCWWFLIIILALTTACWIIKTNIKP